MFRRFIRLTQVGLAALLATSAVFSAGGESPPGPTASVLRSPAGFGRRIRTDYTAEQYVKSVASVLSVYDSPAKVGGATEPQSGYVGSATCARCHANTYATFQQTWHPNMLRPADDSILLGDFASPDPDFTFSRADVKWVLGGQYKQRYLTEMGGQLYVLPAEWNIVTGEWVAYEVENWQARPYGQYCAGCHTTGYDPETQTWLEPGVRCEACHGPGADHVASTGSRAQIVNPAELEFDDQVEVCAQCHSRGEDPSGQFPFPVGYRPGGPAKLSETFVLSTDPDDFWPDGTAKRHHMQYHDWRQGAHGQSVSCVFCHDSHSVGETDHQTRMVGNDRCLVCHEGQTDLAAHIPFMAAKADRVNCTDCHMPQVSKLVPTDFQILSHTFRPPNPTLSLAYGGQAQMPNACNLCHADKTPEWAASVLGQALPPTDATRVPPATPLPVPTRVVAPVAASDGGEVAALPRSQSGSQNVWLAGLVVAALVGLFGAWWARRTMRMKQ